VPSNWERPINIPTDDATAPVTAGSEELTPNTRSRSAKQNWVVRHWRGEEPLVVAFWRNTVILAAIWPFLLLQFYSVINPFEHSLRAGSLAGFLIRLSRYCLWAWAIVGVFRSANQHRSRGGFPLWADVARLIVITGVLGAALQLYFGEWATFKELAAIGVGLDPVPRVTVTTIRDGTAIWLQGPLGEGSAKEVEAALDKNTQVETVVLSSPGGRLMEAEKIATRVRQRYLNTVVRGSCLSACTYILLAGHHRSAADTAKIGFHQPSFPGMTNLSQPFLTRQLTKYYQTEGLPASFIYRVAATPSDDMWYPTHDELRRARVLNAADEPSR